MGLRFCGDGHYDYYSSALPGCQPCGIVPHSSSIGLGGRMKHASWARSTGCLDSVIPVEEEKPEKEQGFYLHPELYHQPIEKSV